MTTPTTMVGFSRFHAIVTARPLNGSGPPVIPEDAYRHATYEPWGVRLQNGKRTREQSDAGPSRVKKVAKRRSEDETNSREQTTLYCDRDGLLTALRDQFRQGPDVDFHGVYEMMDPGVTHKQRIQTLVHEIWKTTGYRFTVKDHPQFTNGHKTRFWCSQDEAHRSKSSRAARKAQGDCYKPRVTSAGEAMAKARYPCRSRLLISSRDSDLPGTRIITVRMHHHVNHEAYIDANLPPDVVQGIRESLGWTGHSSSRTPSNKIEGDGPVEKVPPNTASDEEEEESSEEERGSAEDTLEPPDDDVDPTHTLADNGHQPSPPPPPPLPPASKKYHSRMKAHIKNLREFCEGLEYQLQFNDYRMLDMLEQEGGSFLNLVADCLRKEGRLVPTDLPPVSEQGSSHTLNGHRPESALGGINQSRPYDGNPGINPRALDY
ncbi:hypothetical protein GALMADRAFT_1262756 [Galerina marginata CBS 339.88]|uniref:Uncharacterized protein n=1 Tax=Galerina marginata (strain CBS 339.88) TaxID=685588 RepID=A0A067T6B4_GALM3|nr:hypothetical protein GALMADRAFT_1262756 [Galerina marginata CBS 339.88]